MKNHNRYTATKEEARRIHAILLDAVPIDIHTLRDELLVFLEAVTKRLPTSAAITRDRARREAKKAAEGREDEPNV